MAVVVLLVGSQFSVLVVADPMHWSTVTAAVGVPTGTLLVTLTLQYTLLPPTSVMLLHWFTEVTSWVESIVVTTGPPFDPILRGQEGKYTPGAAKHELVVTTELVAPVELVVFTTVTVQVCCRAGLMGVSGGLH